jgi:hypothetical protein
MKNYNISTSKIELNNTVVVNWVAVTDIVPENRQKVLFSTPNGDVHMAIYLDKLINQYGDYKQVFLADNGGYYEIANNLVSFWCNIPKPPCL